MTCEAWVWTEALAFDNASAEQGDQTERLP